MGADDRQADLSVLKAIPDLVYTEKLDGENSNLSQGFIHARSEGRYNYPWQTEMKRWWAGIRFSLSPELQFCGENLYARHSIAYCVPSYFFLFGIIDLSRNEMLAWDEIKENAKQLGIPVVPEIFRGSLVHLPIPSQSAFGPTCEGYVVRDPARFPVSELDLHMVKCVRANHVQTDEHWTKDWVRNELKR